MQLTQSDYKKAREAAVEFLDALNPTLFREVLQGTPLLRGFKADVSFSPLKVVIKSVSLNPIPARTITPKDIFVFEKHVAENPLSVISMICIDFDYDFKVFKSQYQSFGDTLRFDFTLPNECGAIIAIKCVDVLGGEVMRTYAKGVDS